MDVTIALIGWIVGFLVGLTGMGGGMVMTPLMIFAFGVAPSTAVGTDLIYASITKVFGIWQHWRQRTIDWKIVKTLIKGSVPGALIGVLIMDLLRHIYKLDMFQHIITQILGMTYLAVTIWMMWNMLRKRLGKQPISVFESYLTNPKKLKRHTMLLGLIGGMLVGLTSVGSGTIFMAALLVMYPLPAKILVGTDIVQATLVTGTAGLAHFVSGNVNLHLVLNLLIGSIPGILMGSRMSLKIPELAVRICLLMLLMGSGIQMLGVF